MGRTSWKKRVGRVTVYMRGARYWIYYRNGEVVRRPAGTDRDDALALAARVNAELAEGAPTSLAYKPIELGKLVTAWLEHHEHVKRSSLATVRRYRTAVQHLLDFAAKERSVARSDRVTPATAEAFVRYLRQVKIAPNGHANTAKRTMRDKGIAFVLGTCRSLFSYAAEHRHVPPYAPNPFAKLNASRMPIEDAKPIEPMTAEQERRFLVACDAFQLPIFFTLAYTGLRVGELTHLLIDRDVDLEAGVLRVSSKPSLCWQVKTRSEREVPLLPEVQRVLRDVVGSRTSGLVFLRRRFVGSDQTPTLAGYTFQQLEAELQKRSRAAGSRAEVADAARAVWRDAGAIRESRVRNEFMKVTKRIGLEHLTCPKTLRHMFATALQEAGVDPMVRRDLMGHTSLEMTSHYTHANSATRRSELERLACRFSSKAVVGNPHG